MKTTKRKFAPTKFFTHRTLKNCHIEFTDFGCYLWVSVNVKPAAVRYLSPNNIYEGEKRFVYALKKHIKNPCKRTIREVYEELLSKCMVNSRKAKIKVLGQEVKELETVNN